MKGAIIGILSFGAGVGIGVLTTRAYFKDMYMSAAEEEIEEMRAYTDAKVKSIRNQYKVDEEGRDIIDVKFRKNDADIVREVDDKVETVDVIDKREAFEERIEKLRYNKKDESSYKNYSKPEVEEIIDDEEDYDFEAPIEEVDDEFEEYAAEEIPLEEGTDPYEIDEAEFGDALHGYDKIELKYFEEDNVITDDYDVPIEDVNKLLGMDNVDRFEALGYDNMYIRNPKESCDYELSRCPGSYEEIGGANE